MTAGADRGSDRPSAFHAEEAQLDVRIPGGRITQERQPFAVEGKSGEHHPARQRQSANICCIRIDVGESDPVSRLANRPEAPCAIEAELVEMKEQIGCGSLAELPL